MKNKVLGLLTVLLTGVLFIAVGVLTAADVPDKFLIQNEGYAADKKGPVEFTHKKHTADHKVACAECHHVFKDGKNVWKEGDAVQKCKECHDPNEKKGNADKLQNAFHKNCKNCHKDLVEAGKSTAAPFKKCNDCHQGAS
ncbi:MAG: cytochrome C3 subunit A [Desulfobacteraceae bacterium]|jgi:hypothetical protein|nr:MAG: cytochrome C3 subunit A [Desulfobacteraceae bacterium]